ncbi:hypothetical protein NB640_10585 [Oxalobacter vibrioformis]|uniref:Uncharacterized protein n=1 Tax=Oxalobacter vibrioformis TaxID=933080 RepID=A0A9E9LYN5_9BURK|nr:hypothetical protein [Oxalobacter vibrioformis]WAW09663.1 hypothetical protein NB640_10585 [Oxalobacter vibrioformis]
MIHAVFLYEQMAIWQEDVPINLLGRIDTKQSAAKPFCPKSLRCIEKYELDGGLHHLRPDFPLRLAL